MSDTTSLPVLVYGDSVFTPIGFGQLQPQPIFLGVLAGFALIAFQIHFGHHALRLSLRIRNESDGRATGDLGNIAAVILPKRDDDKPCAGLSSLRLDRVRGIHLRERSADFSAGTGFLSRPRRLLLACVSLRVIGLPT